MDEDRYRFVAEWFDPIVKTKRTFLLTYYVSDGSVEMYDVNLKRPFLKRMKCDSVDVNDMYVGSFVNILSRQLHIVDFGDGVTRNRFHRVMEATLAIIKHSGFPFMGKIFDVFCLNDLSMSKARMMKITRDGSAELFKSSSLVYNMIDEPFIVLELRGSNAIGILMKLMGIEVSGELAVPASPQYELGDLKSHCLGHSDANSIQKELDIFFPANDSYHCNTAVFNNTTCCIIKPHAVREGLTGKILQAIYDGGFEVTALELISLDLTSAAEFYEVYKGVVSEYKDMTTQLVSGSCIALEIKGVQGSNTAEEFRKLVGPSNPEVGRQLRPNTLRAQFGYDKIKNAVHCSDLPEDAILEVEYLFKILSIS